MSRFTRLSNDKDTGESTINGQPASKQAVRDLLHQPGKWDNGEFITLDLGEIAVNLQSANCAARDVVAGMVRRRG